MSESIIQKTCLIWYQSKIFSSQNSFFTFAEFHYHDDNPTVSPSHNLLKNQENPRSSQIDTSAQNTSDQSQGYFYPNFLHHNDNTNLVLVTEQLMKDNYVSWSHAMTIGLYVKNKIGFIDGTISRPTGDLLPAWIRNNNIVISWILNFVSKPISASILFSDSTRVIWIDLK